MSHQFPPKRRGQKPKFDHEKIEELLKAGEKPFKIMLLLGCSMGFYGMCERKWEERKYNFEKLVPVGYVRLQPVIILSKIM
jgi:hypothetical protein